MLLDEILEMNKTELLAYVKKQSAEMGIDFDPEMLDGDDKKQALYNFIADNIHTGQEFQSVLHSECQLEPGCAMFSGTEDEEDLEEAMEHDLFKK